MTEENNTPKPKKENEDLKLTPEEEGQLKKKLEELRKRDPFVYR